MVGPRGVDSGCTRTSTRPAFAVLRYVSSRSQREGSSCACEAPATRLPPTGMDRACRSRGWTRRRGLGTRSGEEPPPPEGDKIRCHLATYRRRHPRRSARPRPLPWSRKPGYPDCVRRGNPDGAYVDLFFREHIGCVNREQPDGLWLTSSAHRFRRQLLHA